MAFRNPVDSIILPDGATTGKIRMVVGADTPDELQAYGIVVAMLFYVTDFESGLESGYFFVGLSNTLDVGNDEACVFGSVRYPVYGNPNSPVMSSVKTHFQMSWDFTGTGATNTAHTVFKDHRITIQDTVPFFASNALINLFANHVRFDGITEFPYGIKPNEPQNNTINFIIDPDMYVFVNAPGKYLLSGWIGHRSTTTADFKMRFKYGTAFADAELRWSSTARLIGGAVDYGYRFNDGIASFEGTGGFSAFNISGALTATASGFLQFEWAQATLDALNPSFLLKDSWLRLERVK